MNDPIAPVSVSQPQSAVAKKAPRWAVALATGFGAGFLPVMPGTYGAAEGVVLSVIVAAATRGIPHQTLLLCVGVVLLSLFSLFAIGAALPYFSSEDPSAVVLDEVAGQALTLLPLSFLPQPQHIPWLALFAGFMLFRIFDTLKPYPIWKLGFYHGALGVLADDLGAGVVGGAILYAIARVGWV